MYVSTYTNTQFSSVIIFVFVILIAAIFSSDGKMFVATLVNKFAEEVAIVFFPT